MAKLFYHALVVPMVKQFDSYIANIFYNARIQKPGYGQHVTKKSIKLELPQETEDTEA